jgi:hypothetical protein
MPYRELKSQTLRDEKFQIKDVGGSSFRDTSGIFLEGYWVVCGFGCEK